MFHLNDNFKKKLSPATWRNMVSAFLNNLCGDGCIDVVKPEEPNSGNPPKIMIRWRNFIDALAQRGYSMAQENTYATGTGEETLANAQALAQEAPKPDKYVNETVETDNTEQQIADNLIALIGVSKKVAREDHRHKLETEQGTAKFRPGSGTQTSTMPSDTLPSGSQFALKTDTWKPDNTNGFNMLVVSRIEHDTDNGVHYMYYRQVKYSKNGNPIEVGAEIGAVAVMA